MSLKEPGKETEDRVLDRLADQGNERNLAGLLPMYGHRFIIPAMNSTGTAEFSLTLQLREIGRWVALETAAT